MTTPPWWERYPGRLEDEIARLEASGWSVDCDERLLADEERIVLHLADGPHDGLGTARIEFPDHYPFTKPYVFSDDLDLPRHYSPVTGEICLLADGTIHWDTTDTVAGLIDAQYPQVAQAAALDPPSAAAAGLEFPAPEPARLYLTATPMPQSAILIDLDWDAVPATSGTMELAYFPDAIAADEAGRTFAMIKGVVADIRDRQGTVLAEADPRLLLPGMRRATVRWAALDGPPVGTDLAELSAQIHRRAPTVSRADRVITQRAPNGDERAVEILAALYVDEIRHGQKGVDAVFVGRGATPSAEVDPRGHRQAAIRTFRAGPAHLLERVPALAGMPHSSVLQVGVGGLGAPTARALARAQLGRLTMMDLDHVDPAATPRFPAGVYDAGSDKATLLAQQIRRDHTYIEVIAIVDMIGRIRSGPERRQDDRLEELIADHDLVLDATAEVGVQYLLSDACRRLGKPYIAVWATEGAWGGAVARLRGTDRLAPCYPCLQATLDREGVLPPRDVTAGAVTPAGCSSPTFTGTGFDLAPLVAECTRTVASTLSDAYPNLDWDLTVLALRDEQGRPIPPTWQAHQIDTCEHHRP